MAASTDPAIPKSLLVFNQIRQHVTQWERRLASTLSPARKHKEELKVVNAKLEAAWSRIFGIQDMSKRRQAQDEIQGYASELERLETKYKCGFVDAQAEYEREVDAVVKAVCEQLGELIITVLGLRHFTTSRETASCGGCPDEPDHSMNPRGQFENRKEWPGSVRSAETRKRKRDWDVPGQQDCQKPAKGQISERSIPFEDVFQNGNAPIKHVIVQWPPDQDNWYIIRCNEHDLNFKDNPLPGGAAHLRGKKHRMRSSDHNTVIESLGIEVLGCDENLAETNNTAAREAFKNGYEHATTNNTQASKEKAFYRQREGECESAQAAERQERNGRGVSFRHDNQRQHKKPLGIIDPKCGQVYCAYWKLSKQWLAALLLPMGTLDDIGIPGSIEDLGLLRDLPQCYAYDSQTKTYSWGEGYQGNGPRVSMREFPVMFFDGSPFPGESSVAWVGAKDLQDYDMDARHLIEHNWQVLDYLEARERSRRPKMALEVGSGDSAVVNPSRPAPTTSRNQVTTENSQSKTNSAPMAPPQEEASSKHAPQRVNDNSLPQGRPGQSPRSGNHGVTTGVPLQGEFAAGSGENIIRAPLPPTAETDNGNEAAPTTSPSKSVAQSPQQQHIQPMNETLPNLTEVARTAYNLIDTGPSTTESARINPVHGPRHPSLGQQQELVTPQTSFATAGQPSQAENIFQSNANRDTQTLNQEPSPILHFPPPGFSKNQRPTQLPPIHTREEHSPPVGQGSYWPPGMSVFSIDNSRPSVSTSANAQQLPLFGVLQPPGFTMAPTIPVPRQTPVGAVARQEVMWLSEFSPSLVNQLKRVTQLAGRDPRLSDFVNPQGDLECPFCRKVCARAVVFNKHLTERCLFARAGPLHSS